MHSLIRRRRNKQIHQGRDQNWWNKKSSDPGHQDDLHELVKFMQVSWPPLVSLFVVRRRTARVCSNNRSGGRSGIKRRRVHVWYLTTEQREEWGARNSDRKPPWTSWEVRPGDGWGLKRGQDRRSCQYEKMQRRYLSTDEYRWGRGVNWREEPFLQSFSEREQHGKTVKGGNGKQGGRGEERGLAPCCLSLNALRRSLPPSLPPFSTHTRRHTHSAQLAHKGAVAIKPAQRGAQIERERQREDSALHEQ